MGAIGNYEVVTQSFNIGAALTGTTITVSVPTGKVAIGWGVNHTDVLDQNGNPTGTLNRDLIVNGHPASDGSSVTFQFYEAQSGNGAVGILYVTCAEMGC